MAKSNYEKQLRETIIKIDGELESLMDIMFASEPKSFGEISDYQIESKIQVDGGVNRLIALAEHYQKNFENPQINELLKSYKGYKEKTDPGLFKIIKKTVESARKQELNNVFEKWLKN